MPTSRFAGSLSTPKLDVAVDMGNPFLNRTVDGFLKIGTVAAARAAAEEAFHMVNKGKVSRHDLEHSLKKMCKEGAYYGTVAGVYVGMEYGVSKIRGVNDWKSKMIGGALTGALVSAATNGNREKLVIDAITGGAIATAVDVLNCLT
ncbi:Outer envelope pore protein 16, chloroplastic [Ancistrocladus abbreviatus]